MSIGSLYTAKDAASTYQPLLLATITFSDGTVLRLSTHDQTGGATYGGNSYLPYIVNKEIAATQALGEQGIDFPASVNLRLADSAYTLWNNYETGHGFKGSRLELVAVMYDVIAGGYSSDSRTIFRGTCKEPGGKLPQHDGKILTVGFASRFNMTDLPLPALKIQASCPWVFPETLAERQAAADNAASISYRCGYSPDATGGNARGNYETGTTPFPACPNTADACKARGMFEKDSSLRVTGRFGGIQWNPPGQTQSVRNYITGKFTDVQASSNEARYGASIPMLYGRAWTDPLVINTLPDGNFLTITALVCFGQIDAIFDVVVNDYHIPHTYNDTESPISTGIGISNNTEAAQSGWWICLNKGDRDGAPGIANSGEDPYGSYCVLRIAVPLKVASAGSIPRVRVYAEKGTSYPADQIQDILTNWAGWGSAELDSSSFTTAAAYDAAVISYQYQPGVSGTQHRFTSSLYLNQPQTVADVLRGLRNCRRGIIAPNEAGLLQLRTKQTLADQQPSAVTGSNYATAIVSKHADGTAHNGYAAYRFDESNIQSIKVTLITNGNTYSAQFQNADNLHSQDALQAIDSEDIRRSGQNIPGVFTVMGADNYNLLHRLIATDTAEHFRGNWRSDTGGSVQVEITTSFRAVHLSIGDLCLVNWELLGISDQLFRVTAIAPTTNFETATITLVWHEDDWYVDTYGQVAQSTFTNRFRDKLKRPSFPWLPYGEQPVVGDSIFDRTDWSFGLSVSYTLDAGGDAIPQVTISGRKIVNTTNESLTPPIVPVQGTTASTGGTIEGGRTFWVKLVAVDVDGELSSTSNLVSIGVPAGTNTNTITVPDLLWDAATDTYLVFAGRTPNALSYQSGGSGSPSSITLTSLAVSQWGPPDSEFDKYRIRLKIMAHPGAWAWPVDAVTSTTIKIAAPAAFTVNQYAGCDLSWTGISSGSGQLPIANFRIASNTADTLTLAGGAPDPVALGMAVGDVVALRSGGTFGSDSFGDYIDDPNWASCFSPSGLPVDDEVGLIIRFIAGTGRGLSAVITKNTATKIYADFGFTPDSTSRYIIEAPSGQTIDTDSINNADANGDFSFTVPALNYSKMATVIQVFTLDGGGNESIEAQSPVRDFYLFGLGLRSRVVTADDTIEPEDQVIEADSTAGPITLALLPKARYTHPIYIKKISSDGNSVDVVPDVDIDGDASVSLVLKGDTIGIAPGA